MRSRHPKASQQQIGDSHVERHLSRGLTLAVLVRIPGCFLQSGVAITVERDEHRRWLRARVTGNLTIAEAITFLRTVRATPETREWALLFDATGATTTMTEEDVDRAVKTVASVS